MKKKKGIKNKSLKGGIRIEKGSEIAEKLSPELPSKKTSKASTRIDSSSNRSKLALLSTKTNDYLKSYLEFSKKSKESQKFF